jgi:endonuclease-8
VRSYVDAPGRATPVDHLGPDLCREDVDLDEVLQRIARIPEPDATVAEVLLDQRVAAGVGNVFKSEVLWACRVDPFLPIASVPEPTRAALVSTAAAQLQANLATRRRQTVSQGLAVYGRARQPCRACGLPIRAMRHGEQARVTYWCPNCQPPGAGLPEEESA